MTRDQLKAAVLTAPTPQGRATQHKRLYGIEDYLFIGGPTMSARQAAQRLGVTMRTICRWRAVLRNTAARPRVREATGLDDPALTWAGAPVSAPAWWIHDHDQGEL